MSVVNPQPAAVHSRRRVLAWTAGATLAATTARFGIAAARQATPEAPATTGTTFLDPDLVHDIAVMFDQAIYEAMIATFAETGDKEWIEATVTIDGATYDTAGMRLKGNSSLGGIRRPTPPEDGVPETTGENEDSVTLPAGTGENEGPSTNAEGEPNATSAETPEHLPWLVRLDKYVDDQAHQGITELVIRSNPTATSLNEAVALDLLARAGLASELAAYARFSVNGRDPVLRLAIEHPNDSWMTAHFPAGGFLYKAEAGGDFSYRGDDPAAYNDIFDLEAGATGDDAADYQPLFGFLAFLNDSDDETFIADLPNHLDVDAFATYLAMMDLIENFDDITGPGNNAYLHVDPGAEQFTVVPWDMNLSFGGPGMNRIEILPDGATPEAPLDGGPDFFHREPEIGGTPVAGMACDGEDCRQVGPSMQPNILVERWTAVATFADLVPEARDRLQAGLYASGVATDILGRWVGILEEQATDMVDEGTIAEESDAITEIIASQ
jgi:spore coat protein CotH